MTTTIIYYDTQSDALNNDNIIHTQSGNVISYNGPEGQYDKWRISSNSTGASTPGATIYNFGISLIGGNVIYRLYPAVPTINYYPSLTDATNYTNIFTNSILGLPPLTVGPNNSITQWKIASNSTGSFDTNTIYTNETLVPSYYIDVNEYPSFYNLYPAPSVPCFLEGTNILCQVDGVEKYIPIETMRKDTIVKTLNGFKKVVLIGKRPLYNPGNNERIKDRLYKYSNDIDLFITGCHSVLVDNLTDKQRKDTLTMLGDIYVTEGKYRLIACVDDRSEPWNSEGTYTIWHFALEHPDIKMNYGVYANGLLVESCSINYLKNKSNMTIV